MSAGDQYGGRRGEQYHVEFELQSIADIGLVGFPNAGKSSLLGRLSRARPTVASYAFTTLRPHIGVLQYPDYACLRIADLPGLIEGAHDNIGMGHACLRHVERTHALLYVLDVAGFRLGPDHAHRTAYECLTLLHDELRLYSPRLPSKSALIALNKMDRPQAQLLSAEFQQLVASDPRFSKVPLVPISAATGLGLDELRQALRQVRGPARPGLSNAQSLEAFRRQLYGIDGYDDDKYRRIVQELNVNPMND